MTGKRYYMTTLGDWQRHAARFATSHFIVLDAPASSNDLASGNPGEFLVDRQAPSPGMALVVSIAEPCHAPTEEKSAPVGNARILALIEADEGAHLALEDDAAFEALPHPLAQKPISNAAQSALAVHGVAPGATTFDAAEAVARVHPLLRHRVF